MSYIMPGKKLHGAVAPCTRQVSRFIEKPERFSLAFSFYAERYGMASSWFSKLRHFSTWFSKIAPLLYRFFERIWKAIEQPQQKKWYKKCISRWIP